MNFGIKKLVLLLLVTFFLFVSARIVHSQTDTPTPTPAQDNTQAINDLQNKINAAKAQKQTYSTQIELIGNQIKLTEYKIEATQEQITSVTLDIDTTSKKIASLQGTLDTSIAVLINRIIATYEVGTIQPFQILLTSNNASDFFSRLNYLKLAQAHDKQLIYDTQQAKVDYSNQKTILEDKKKQLANLQQQLQTQTTQ
jgi:peptidoglycan hydrolase CwlO-like protein